MMRQASNRRAEGMRGLQMDEKFNVVPDFTSAKNNDKRKEC